MAFIRVVDTIAHSPEISLRNIRVVGSWRPSSTVWRECEPLLRRIQERIETENLHLPGTARQWYMEFKARFEGEPAPEQLQSVRKHKVSLLSGT
jgi:hypothetical protein